MNLPQPLTITSQACGGLWTHRGRGHLEKGLESKECFLGCLGSKKSSLHREPALWDQRPIMHSCKFCLRVLPALGSARRWGVPAQIGTPIPLIGAYSCFNWKRQWR